MPRKVLVVDDVHDVVFMIEIILRSEGFEVVSTSGVTDAISTLEVPPAPDLVLLDLQLADGEGWNVLERLRSEERLREVPVVILSARSRAEHEARAREAGATAYMTKPFAASTLIDNVRKILG